MYAVIFTATVGDQDSRYRKMAGQLRDLAMTDFGCTEFISVTEGEQEIALSYWPDEDAIKDWKQQAEHRVAQQLGKEGWYKHYKVEVVKILRAYDGP
ncbi:antibiotic biosynthesis monooxygenase [Alcanivorax jadensis]|uniref:antibiotic biosynthesis monooxygenase family protein n=1 Tax=Alcanivorax jadensis TaxID=64988 RepID=UPI0026E97515|nr:antibiotic biosynthesis monooxygenase [Alcanivorax jadensis]